MAWTQTEIDALKSAIAKGVTTVSYRDRSVSYRSLDEMLQLLQLMESEANPGSQTRTSYVQFSRGD